VLFVCSTSGEVEVAGFCLGFAGVEPDVAPVEGYRVGTMSAIVLSASEADMSASRNWVPAVAAFSWRSDALGGMTTLNTDGEGRTVEVCKASLWSVVDWGSGFVRGWRFRWNLCFSAGEAGLAEGKRTKQTRDSGETTVTRVRGGE